MVYSILVPSISSKTIPTNHILCLIISNKRRTKGLIVKRYFNKMNIAG